MKTALWTKLKSVGVPENAFEELERFQFWLPVPLQPINRSARGWIERFSSEKDARQRLMLEMQAIDELRKRLTRLQQKQDRSLLIDFMDRLRESVLTSQQMREHALRGDLRVEPEFDDVQVKMLRQWLQKHRHGEDRVIAGWLDHIVMAWYEQRRAA